MIETLDKYASFLWERFMTDMDILSSKWMYIPLLIPFLFYMVFFVIKWYILLFPITLPLSILKGFFKVRINRPKKYQIDFVEGEVLKEMHDDIEDLGVPHSKIQDLTRKWRKRYSISRRKNENIID
jgi:hypothetical protein